MCHNLEEGEDFWGHRQLAGAAGCSTHLTGPELTGSHKENRMDGVG